MSIAHISRRATAVAVVSATGLALAAAGPAAAQAPQSATSLRVGFMSNSSHTAIVSVGVALETMVRKN